MADELPDVEAFAAEVAATITEALTPLRERLAAVEAIVTRLGDVRDRVIAVEAKSSTLAPGPEFDLQARVIALEAKALQAGPAGPPGRDGAPGTHGRDGVDGKAGAPGDRGPDGLQGPPGPSGRDGRDGLQGLAGEKGVAGANGQDGAPGRDGTLEHLKASYDGARTLTLTFKDGTPVEGGTLRLPIPLDEGPWDTGTAYLKGAVVSYESSGWVSQQDDNREQPGTSKAWRLMVRRGREGKPGRDGVDLKPLPVVAVGRRD